MYIATCNFVAYGLTTRRGVVTCRQKVDEVPSFKYSLVLQSGQLSNITSTIDGCL